MKLAASTLALSIVLTAPGLAPYQAAAQMVKAPVAAANVGTVKTGSLNLGTPNLLPNVSLGSINTGVNVSIPAPVTNVIPNGARDGSLPLAGAIAPSAVLPAVNIPGSVSPSAVAPQAVVPGALEAGQQLQQEIQKGQGDQAIEKFYTGRKLEGSDDKLPPAAGSDSAASGASDVPNANLNPSSNNGGATAGAPKGPVSPETNPELFAPRSSRVGISPLKYVYWNTIYNVLQWFNLKLARDPNRRVSWDKWPTKLGLLYLIGKIRRVRSGTLTDPYDYAANDIKPAGQEPEQAKRGYTADGSWVSDRENPRMGAENTRFGSNIPPQKVRPDVEQLMLKAREIGKLRHRKEVDGKRIVQPALILNDLAGGWIQFQFHNFGGNTKRDPIEQNPHRVEMPAKEGWAEKDMVVDRTTKDPTRVTENGRPTVMNERTQAWIQAQIYGTNEAEQQPLRTFKDGLMLLDENGNLPPNPAKPGIDLSGFVNNYNPLLSFLHWAFVVNHNNIAKDLKKNNPDWDDAKLFDYARKINVAIIDSIHTVEWTEDLLQHPTLQEGMHAEFYGLFGPKIKAWLMRYSYRHPWFAKLIKPISNNDVIWGMPGSKWEHHDGPFQVPKHFRMVYRLHEMILDEHDFIEPGTDRLLGRADLINFVHQNTRPIVEKYGYDVLAYSFVKKSAGALKLHNFPTALTQFRNMQNNQLTDLAMLDTFREMTDGTGSYNEFRRSVGEPPVTSFMELTGGDAELAKELERTFEGDIEAVPPGIGILAEPKPAGFALGFTQFYQFVLNAPRRVKSNRHLTEYFTHKDYTFEGMEWVLHSGGMGGVIARAMANLPHGKAVIDAMEGVTRWFAPWPSAETFPVRMLDKTEAGSNRILKLNLITLGLSLATAAGIVLAGIASPTIAAFFPVAATLPVFLYFKRMLAWRFMQKTWQSAYTDRRRSMFPTLFKGEKWAGRAVRWGKFFAKAAFVVSAIMAWTLFPTDPIVASLFVATAISALMAKSATAAYANDMEVLRISLQNRLREGYTDLTQPAQVRGSSAIERRYSMLIPPGSVQPTARILHSYRVLHEQGLPRLHAFKTALISHLIFGPRTQRGLGIKGRWKAGILFNPFAIYVPNMVQAQGPSTTRIYAGQGNEKGIKPGDVDVEEFDRMFRTYAPGRDYMTAYDFSRMAEGNRWRAAQEGVGGPFSRWVGGIAVGARTKQLMQLYADRVANEDKTLVPAISREMLLRVYQGTAQADLMKERALDGVHPDLQSPEAKARKTFRQRWNDVRKMGWKAVAIFLALYALKGVATLWLIKYLLG